MTNGSLIVNAAQHKALHRSLSCEAGEGKRVWGCGGGCGGYVDALREIGPSAMREVAIEVPKVHSELFSLRTLYL